MPPPAVSSATPHAAPVFRLLDPCNDFVFKTLFVENPPLLVDLVNAVRSHLLAIEDIEILNPAIPPEPSKARPAGDTCFATTSSATFCLILRWN